MRKIPIGLRHEHHTLVDDCDYYFLMRWSWYSSGNKKYIYAIRKAEYEDYVQDNNCPEEIRMHRVIMKTPSHLEVDHVDHDTLNNQRYNLKNVTKRQNAENRHDQSETVGVRKTKTGYVAIASIDGKQTYLGTYKSSSEAVQARIDGIEKAHTIKQLDTRADRRVR